MSKITTDAHKRCAAHTLAKQLAAVRDQLTPDEHIAIVDHLLTERRKRNEYIMTERRGMNPQRRGYESHDQDDTAFALASDRFLDEKDD